MERQEPPETPESKDAHRLRAESAYEQNKEAFVDRLHELAEICPEGYQMLLHLVHLGSADAMRVLNEMHTIQRMGVLMYLIPAARLGMAVATFSMYDKYGHE